MIKRTPALKHISRLLQVTLLLLIAGCEVLPLTLLPAVLPVVAIGASGGVSYTFTNIAYATMAHPLDEVEKANRAALEHMRIRVLDMDESDNVVRLRAETRRLAIYITLERMTPNLTRIKVNAKKYLLLKDKLTALKIIVQTGKFLPEEVDPARESAG